ncbi:SprT family zinc-dependent metalloprotease [Sphingomonas sp.]|uniref:M48 family metallopeptidase n=1 Tax=Sphingomonas sp. TaxID=28214 RepID=UPI002E3610E3|nr:SprT family zinc-dependent metalloprotease [Sphingomonas sp.]HEX4695145.1 SprT family zinc-dependent metalloprotease [Sphingomonas sp.]
MTPDIHIVRHARARRMRLSVDPASGRVRLTLPPRASLKRAMAWAEEHRGWIEAQRGRFPDARPFAPGALIPVEGEDVVIDWLAERPRTIRVEEGRLVCGGPLEGLSRRIESWLKRRALATLSDETAEFAARAGVAVTRVTVGDPKARWGSCASTGAIRYSWRLICAPPHVRRATVAHEVAHRLHMDHSRAFHTALRGLYGADPAPARAWLKRHGASLHWLGRCS